MNTQALQNSSATIQMTWEVDGLVVDPGQVGVTVTSMRRGMVGNNADAEGLGIGPRTFKLLPEHTRDLDLLTVTWECPAEGDRVSYVDVVGDLLFSVKEARDFRPRTAGVGPLANASLYPAALIEGARFRIAADFERILEVAPYQRYKRVVMSGPGPQELGLPDLHIRVIHDVAYRDRGSQVWVDVDLADIPSFTPGEDGLVIYEGRGVAWADKAAVRVGYEYGLGATPANLKHAALLVVTGGDAVGLVGSDIDYRATSFSDGLGTLRYLTPGLGRGDIWYSHPDVNRILQDFREHVPKIG